MDQQPTCATQLPENRQHAICGIGIKIPIGPPAFLELKEGDPGYEDLYYRPNLGTEYFDTTYRQCACWDALIPVLHLLEEPSDALPNLCLYHRHYLFRRVHLKQSHSCRCHYEPDCGERCLGCGYCHKCGCDLITTSTPHFHRCSCVYCLLRCCPHPQTLRDTQKALLRHEYLQRVQAAARCAPGAPIITEYKSASASTRPLSRWELAELRRLYSSIPAVPAQRRRYPVNTRWPTDAGYAVDVRPERAIPGFTSEPLSASLAQGPDSASQSAATGTAQAEPEEPLVTSPTEECSCAAAVADSNQEAVDPGRERTTTLPPWRPLDLRPRIKDDWDLGGE